MKAPSVTDSEESQDEEDTSAKLQRREEEKFSHLRDEATLRIGSIGYVRDNDEEEKK